MTNFAFLYMKVSQIHLFIAIMAIFGQFYCFQATFFWFVVFIFLNMINITFIHEFSVFL